MTSRNLLGLRFSRLLVIGEGPKRRMTYWRCECDCGCIKNVRHDHLAAGLTTSCGCWRSEQTRKRNRTHGVRAAVEYGVWGKMIQRCENPNNPKWKYYGARGIKVCKRWRRSFAAFLQDMGPRPSGDHSVERRDNDGPYSKRNCIWATRIEQANNKRNNARVTIFGRTQTVAQWKREIGISQLSITSEALRAIVTFCDATTRRPNGGKKRGSDLATGPEKILAAA